MGALRGAFFAFTLICVSIAYFILLKLAFQALGMYGFYGVVGLTAIVFAEVNDRKRKTDKTPEPSEPSLVSATKISESQAQAAATWITSYILPLPNTLSDIQVAHFVSELKRPLWQILTGQILVVDNHRPKGHLAHILEEAGVGIDGLIFRGEETVWMSIRFSGPELPAAVWVSYDEDGPSFDILSDNIPDGRYDIPWRTLIQEQTDGDGA